MFYMDFLFTQGVLDVVSILLLMSHSIHYLLRGTV